MIKYRYNDAIQEWEIDPQFIEEGLACAEKEGFPCIRILCLNQNAGRKYDLDFSIFSNRLFITGLDISDSFRIRNLSNLEELYTLSNLRTLSFRDSKFAIDFSRLPQLEKLILRYNKKLKNISALKNLKHILIESLNEGDLQLLSGLESLQILRLTRGTFISTSGIEGLSKIERMDIHYQSKVQDISNINALPNLWKLHIERCKSLSNYSFLKGNTSIKDLFIDNLDSIDFVPSMPNLEKIYFWCSKDGNMSPLLESKSLKSIYFSQNKKYYSHTVQQIHELTGTK